MIGGSVVIETVFGWPGIGTLAFNALQSRDLNLLLGIFFISCLVVIINLIVEISPCSSIRGSGLMRTGLRRFARNRMAWRAAS